MAPNYERLSDIPYTTTNHHPRQVLDLYIPGSEIHPEKLPVILYIHGGAFRLGDKQSQLLPLRQIDNSYAIATINYRRSGEAIFPAMVEDCKSALRFLKSSEVVARYGLDSSRVVVWGESAGGHAAAMLGTTSSPTPGGHFDVGDHLDVSSEVVGVVDYYGPTDFLQMDAHLPEGYQTHNDRDSPESMYLGTQITQIPEEVRDANPCTYVREISENHGGNKKPEFFIAHGTADKIVPAYMSRLLVQELEEFGIRYEYLPVEGADHVFRGITEEQQKELDKRTDAFLARVFGA